MISNRISVGGIIEYFRKGWNRYELLIIAPWLFIPPIYKSVLEVYTTRSVMFFQTSRLQDLYSLTDHDPKKKVIDWSNSNISLWFIMHENTTLLLHTNHIPYSKIFLFAAFVYSVWTISQSTSQNTSNSIWQKKTNKNWWLSINLMAIP